MSLFHGKTDMLAKKTVKNQITLPKALVDELPDTEYFELRLEGGETHSKSVVLECAVSGKDQVLLSGDNDLPGLGHFRKVAILSPSQFFSRFFQK